MFQLSLEVESHSHLLVPLAYLVLHLSSFACYIFLQNCIDDLRMTSPVLARFLFPKTLLETLEEQHGSLACQNRYQYPGKLKPLVSCYNLPVGAAVWITRIFLSYMLIWWKPGRSSIRWGNWWMLPVKWKDKLHSLLIKERSVPGKSFCSHY